eukprot:13365650-Ditylum_brightwellii.AAC.1
MSNATEKGGCYKMGNLSCTEVLTVYHLSGCGSNPIHAINTVINEKNTTTKCLQEIYEFSKLQRDKLLKVANLTTTSVFKYS